MAALQPLERLYRVGERHVGGCQCLPAHQRTNGTEQKLEVLHGVVALNLLGWKAQKRTNVSIERTLAATPLAIVFFTWMRFKAVPKSL